MTVLIKGMEMPENCAKCPICAFMPLGGYVVYHKCVLLNRLASKHNRRYDCPLVEVPTPHGRLIDADKLYKWIKAECNPYGKPRIGYEDGNKVLDIIKAASTVIEAEGEE